MSSPIEEPPPLLGSWRRLYAVVLLVLVADIVIGALVTWSYAP